MAPRSPRSLWLLIFAAWLVPALLSGLNTYMQSRLDGQPPEWRWVLFNSVDWLLYALLTPIVFYASRRFPMGRPHFARKLILHVAGALAMCLAWASLGTLLRLVIFSVGNLASVVREFVSWVFVTLPFGVGVYFALVGIERSLFYSARAREREIQLSKAQLSALRMQFNPHFLFNSLNAITVLVRDGDKAAASQMLELLSDVLRQVLRTDAAQETTLSEEIDFLKRYLAIEQIRFSDRLRPHIDINPNLMRAAIPAFLLQPLVENALRHGIARRSQSGILLVTAHRDGSELVVTVQDDGPGLSATTGGVGLPNTRARLAALYGEQATFQIANREEGGVIATVRLPYHEAIRNA